MPGSLHIMPSLALAYIAINLRDPALKDIRVRRALNLVYDREAVTQKVLKLGEPPAYSYVPPGIGGLSRTARSWTSSPCPIRARLAQAHKLMQDAGYGPFNRLTLTYVTHRQSRQPAAGGGVPGDGAADLCRSPHPHSDYAILLRDLRQRPVSAGLYQLAGRFQTMPQFPGPAAFDSPGNYAGYHNPSFDAVLDGGGSASRMRPRAHALLQAAEGSRRRTCPGCPSAFCPRPKLVAPRVGGYVPNAADFNRSRWLWIKK